MQTGRLIFAEYDPYVTLFSLHWIFELSTALIPAPVSYTHLDVYKRQDHARPHGLRQTIYPLGYILLAASVTTPRRAINSGGPPGATRARHPPRLRAT